jgi:hypothetical protein
MLEPVNRKHVRNSVSVYGLYNAGAKKEHLKKINALMPGDQNLLIN